MSTPTSGYLNLFLNGGAYTPTSGHLPLFLTGNTSGTTYKFSTLPLYLSGEAFHSSLNLYLTGSDTTHSNSGALNLYLSGRGEPVSSGINLYLTGSTHDWPLSLAHLTQEELDSLTPEELDALPLDADSFFGYPISSGLPLFIQGDGTFDGFYPTSGYLNLFLQNTGVGSGISMYIRGLDTISSNIPLFLGGISGIANSGINLYIFGTTIQNSPLKLFTRGYDPILGT